MSAPRVIRRVVKSAATAVNRIFQRSQSTVLPLGLHRAFPALPVAEGVRSWENLFF